MIMAHLSTTPGSEEYCLAGGMELEPCQCPEPSNLRGVLGQILQSFCDRRRVRPIRRQ
jgi:hypothetical protein